MPRGTGIVGASTYLSVAPTGELAVRPAGAFLAAANLTAGQSATGVFAVRNQTGTRLAIRLRALTDNTELDGTLDADVRAGSHSLAHTTLRGLRSWTREPLVLDAGEEARIAITIGLRRGLPLDAYAARILNAPIELQATPVATAKRPL